MRDGDSRFLQNVGIYLQVHMALQPRRPTLTQEIETPNYVNKCQYKNVLNQFSGTNITCELQFYFLYR
jgi:hypothetical protein